MKGLKAHVLVVFIHFFCGKNQVGGVDVHLRCVIQPLIVGVFSCVFGLFFPLYISVVICVLDSMETFRGNENSKFVLLVVRAASSSFSLHHVSWFFFGLQLLVYYVLKVMDIYIYV